MGRKKTNKPVSIRTEDLICLRTRMVKVAQKAKHPNPEEIASEYVLRLLEGRHKRATVGQAYVDIVRIEIGRMGSPNQESRKALQGVIHMEQTDITSYIQIDEGLSLDARLDLEKILHKVKTPVLKEIFLMRLRGDKFKAIAKHFKKSEAWVNLLYLEELDRLRQEFSQL